ncbi:MAG: hypothetical protein M3Y22_13555 [Pseudomonadota bacterium]|nr:hypothetical protein [Pseudomonadota bacterium]
MKESLSKDATIMDVVGSLRSPDAYVSGVFGKLHECRKVHGAAAVRIGITGRGLCPYYRILYDFTAGQPDSSDKIFGAYFDNHTPLEWTTSEATNSLWSSRFATYDEVRALLGEMRPRRNANK